MISTKNYEIVTGAEMIARGAIDAGVNFFAGYPITPTSSVYAAMLNKLQSQGKVAIGTSDEISALAMCIGASMRGAKSMTASAAPGLSLMTEGLGYAFATETPVLIVLGQRLGPSTGSATQSYEGDISFVQGIIAGGYKIPVIAINSIHNAYKLTIKAINLSERLRCPVILLSEKDILMSSTNIDADHNESLELETRPYFDFGSKTKYLNYDFDQKTDIPKFLAAGLGTEHRVVITGSTHDKAGNLSKNSPEALQVLQHLDSKINFEEIYDYDEDKEAKTIVISFLASDLSAKEAIKKARKEDLHCSHLSIYSIFPIPEKILTKIANQYSRIIIPEQNFSGQYANAIKYLFKDSEIIQVNSLADLIKPEAILKLIKDAQH